MIEIWKWFNEHSSWLFRSSKFEYTMIGIEISHKVESNVREDFCCLITFGFCSRFTKQRHANGNYFQYIFIFCSKFLKQNTKRLVTTHCNFVFFSFFALSFESKSEWSYRYWIPVLMMPAYALNGLKISYGRKFHRIWWISIIEIWCSLN